MPVGDSRTWPSARERPAGKRRLGKRDVARADTDALLNELREECVRVVARVLVCGGAIQFGSTRDRGAMLVRAWLGGDIYEDYHTSIAELVATFEAIDDVCDALMRREAGDRP